jgi:hypothetical protein
MRLALIIAVIFHHQCLTHAKLRKFPIKGIVSGCHTAQISNLLCNELKICACLLAEVIRKCSRNDEDINACICKSIEMLRTNLATGDFGENFTFPKLEPLFIDEIKMHRNEFKATFKVIFGDLVRLYDYLSLFLESCCVWTKQFCTQEYEVSFVRKENGSKN